MSKNFFSKKPFSRSYLFSLICRVRVSIEHVKERNTSNKSNNPIDLLFLHSIVTITGNNGKVTVQAFS